MIEVRFVKSRAYPIRFSAESWICVKGAAAEGEGSGLSPGSDKNIVRTVGMTFANAVRSAIGKFFHRMCDISVERLS